MRSQDDHGGIIYNSWNSCKYGCRAMISLFSPGISTEATTPLRFTRQMLPQSRLSQLLHGQKQPLQDVSKQSHRSTTVPFARINLPSRSWSGRICFCRAFWFGARLSEVDIRGEDDFTGSPSQTPALRNFYHRGFEHGFAGIIELQTEQFFMQSRIPA